ncbi:MAG: UvrD-helicase domain-containing protein [Candidatus Brocadiae bacterium]|nr:UvrD-helicase domain-containing protein [Candidatus Brocadiia bacterium]
MRFIADLHIHSRYSRATSHDLTFPNLYKWALYKGINIIGSGDFTHPQWVEEMEEYLEPAPEQGLYALKEKFCLEAQEGIPHDLIIPVRFLLSVEISSIYKKNGRTRKVHNIVFAPNLEIAKKIAYRLSQIGNIKSDGRPILGLDSHHLLEILLQISPEIYLIPAHIWTPWFSLFGANSGFDHIEECFEDLTPYIFALETGLSSDPPMNWMCSQLDRFTLVSNSDAHSPSKLGREANLFSCEFSYPDLFDALKKGDPERFLGTLEFYPDEGKYHLDGHSKCKLRLTPEQSMEHKGRCPMCGGKITLGVLHRISELADRKAGEKPSRIFPFRNLIGLETILGEVLGVKATSKKVETEYFAMLKQFGSELEIISNASLADLEKKGSVILAEAVKRTREGKLQIEGGYDGEFGTIQIFQPGEREKFLPQETFFGFEGTEKKINPKKRAKVEKEKTQSSSPLEKSLWDTLNQEQRDAIESQDKKILVIAGPGTGKTMTLTCRLAHLVLQNKIAAKNILAITFTNKASEEMRSRIQQWLGDMSSEMTICTFHKLGLQIIKENAALVGLPEDFVIYTKEDVCGLLGESKNKKEMLEKISLAKNALVDPGTLQEEGIQEFYAIYQKVLKDNKGILLEDLVYMPVRILQANPKIQQQYQERFLSIAVDEYQDIAYAQHSLLKLLITENTFFFAIGDPDQAIYSFRGANLQYFLDFGKDFPSARQICLSENYRSIKNIVEASCSLVAHNKKRIPNEIKSQKKGKNLQIFEAANDRAEAQFIVHTIQELMGGLTMLSSGKESTLEAPYSFHNFAILYRTSQQNKTLQEVFAESSIPYQCSGTGSFWKEEKIQNWKSLFQLFLLPESGPPLYRLLQGMPGIGEKSIMAWKERKGLHLLENIPFLSSSGKESLELLVKTMQQFPPSIPLEKWIAALSQQIPWPCLQIEKEDFNHLCQASSFFHDLGEFLSYISLHETTEEFEPRAEKVSMLTLHAAKGLEFPVVFIIGCEENILPYTRFGWDEEKEEEERRLFYVGMTRAKDMLYLLHSKKRLLFGKEETNLPTRYFQEIPNSLKSFAKHKLSKPKKRTEGEQLSFF